MKTATPDKSLVYRDLFAAGLNAESAWQRYAKLREEALAVVVERGLATKGLEEWVHGTAEALASGPAIPAEVARTQAELVLPTVLADSHRLVFVNGLFDQDRSELAGLPAGVLVQSLAQGDEAECLGTIANDEASAFTALNTVFWRDGLRLEVADDVHLELPVELVFLNDLDGETAVVPVRNLIRLGAGSSATIIERFALGVDGVIEHPLTEVVCGPRAKAYHIKIIGGTDAGVHHGSTHVIQQAGSRYHSWEILTGGRMARRELHLDLTEPGALCDLNALYMGAGEQRFDLRTRVNHDAAECETQELYKGILGGASRGVFDGLIIVARDSQQTLAQQTNRNLLLSDDAVINSIPRLEIYADDVKCSHGSTTGQIEDEQLFYLRTRGFSEEEARTYRAWAFASEVIESIPVPALREELSEVITRTLDLAANRADGEQI